MPTRFYLHILVVLSTDFTQLERGAHLAVQLILFLRERQHKAQGQQKYAKILPSLYVLDASVKLSFKHPKKSRVQASILKINP